MRSISPIALLSAALAMDLPANDLYRASLLTPVRVTVISSTLMKSRKHKAWSSARLINEGVNGFHFMSEFKLMPVVPPVT